MLRLYLMVEASLGCKCLGVGELFVFVLFVDVVAQQLRDGRTSVGMRRTSVSYFRVDRECRFRMAYRSTAAK
jgi:hypothetical protein